MLVDGMQDHSGAISSVPNPEIVQRGNWQKTLLLVSISCLGVLLGVLSPVERAVSQYSVNVINNRLDVSLPISDRTPDVLRLRLRVGDQLPATGTTIFSTVAQDVAWEKRTAGALVVTWDSDGIWLAAKNDRVLLGELQPAHGYQLEIYGDRSALLAEVSHEGSLTTVAELAEGRVPAFELTGLHVRSQEFVEWQNIRVVTSPSEVPRPSTRMLTGYVLIALGALVTVLSERSSRTRKLRVKSLNSAGWSRCFLKETWWLWLTTLLAIVVVPPSHSESWIIEDLRVMDWVYGVNLGEFLARPFGGLYYLLLSLWAKLVTPVWLLRLPLAVLFVLSATAFVRSFLVDSAGTPLGRKSRIVALMVLSMAVFGQGEWLRPEIPILSMWMLSLSIAVKISERSKLNDTRLIIIGLLIGLISHHPLGVVVAISATVFLGNRLVQLRRRSVISNPVVSVGGVAIALATAALSTLFGHNLGSFRRSMAEFRANSIAHEANFQLIERLKDLNNSTLLLSFLVSLFLASIVFVAVCLLTRKTTLSRKFLDRLLPAILVAATLLVPAGPWALYFGYLAPLAATLLTAFPYCATKSSLRIVLSVASAVCALLLRAVNQPLAESTILVVSLAGFVLLIGLLVSEEFLPAATTAFLLGASLIAAAPILESISPRTASNLSERCNRSPSPGQLVDLHQACFYTWATTDGSQWGDWVNEAISVSRASGGAYLPVSFSMQRLLGQGEDCGFVSKLLHGRQFTPEIDASNAQIAHAYGLLSPCTPPPDAGPNLEALSGVIHGRSHDMNYYGRVLASILEHRDPTAELLCLSKRGVTSSSIAIDVVVRIDEPNCLVLVRPFAQLDPVSIKWSQYSQ